MVQPKLVTVQHVWWNSRRLHIATDNRSSNWWQAWTARGLLTRVLLGAGGASPPDVSLLVDLRG